MMHIRNTGWSRRIRTKVSPRAAEGFLYEVRFKTLDFWKKAQFQAMQDIVDTTRCFNKFKIIKCDRKRHRSYYVVYVGSEADLLIIRMSDHENLVFRVYSLIENA